MAKKPRCIKCNKLLKRKSKSFCSELEPYKGNMICYRKKINPPTEDVKSDNGNFTFPGRKYPTYNYTIWDGESYCYYLGRYRFCGVNCAAGYGISKLPKKEKPTAELSKRWNEIY